MTQSTKVPPLGKLVPSGPLTIQPIHPLPLRTSDGGMIVGFVGGDYHCWAVVRYGRRISMLYADEIELAEDE